MPTWNAVLARMWMSHRFLTSWLPTRRQLFRYIVFDMHRQIGESPCRPESSQAAASRLLTSSPTKAGRPELPDHRRCAPDIEFRRRTDSAVSIVVHQPVMTNPICRPRSQTLSIQRSDDSASPRQPNVGSKSTFRIHLTRSGIARNESSMLRKKAQEVILK